MLVTFESFVTSLIPSLLSPEVTVVLEVVCILVCVLIFLMHMYQSSTKYCFMYVVASLQMATIVRLPVFMPLYSLTH